MANEYKVTLIDSTVVTAVWRDSEQNQKCYETANGCYINHEDGSYEAYPWHQVKLVEVTP
jgi:hypothetical protein